HEPGPQRIGLVLLSHRNVLPSGGGGYRNVSSSSCISASTRFRSSLLRGSIADICSASHLRLCSFSTSPLVLRGMDFFIVDCLQFCIGWATPGGMLGGVAWDVVRQSSARSTRTAARAVRLPAGRPAWPGRNRRGRRAGRLPRCRSRRRYGDL